jgi:tRNA(Ile)-lysidine synthase
VRPLRYAEVAARFPWLERVKVGTESYLNEDRHLVGVSGGADSRVLIHILLLVGFQKLVICHLDHNLRGAESTEDRKFVCRLARRLRIPIYVESLSGLPETGSLETAARAARFEFFARAAERNETQSLILAHHADDQVETFLINLFRGTGSFDNAAIKPESRIRVGGKTLIVRRPLLDVWKHEIYEFAARLGLKFREDVTNASRKMLRNRVRHDLIPEIERIMGRSIKKSLLRTIELATSEGELLKSLVPETALRSELETRLLRKLPVPIQRRTIHAWLRNQGITDYGFDEIESVRSLLDRIEIAKTNLPRGIFCRRKAGQLFLEFPDSGEGASSPKRS